MTAEPTTAARTAVWLYWVTMVVAAALVAIGTTVYLRNNEPTVVSFSQIRIAEQIESDDGVTEVVPTVDGIDGPAVVGSLEMCGDDEGCFTVPLVFDMTNHTDEDVISETFGQWHNLEHGRACGSSETPFQLLSPPGITTLAFPSQPPRCVVEDLNDFAAEGVTESVWQITAVIDPIGDGMDVKTESQNFTIVVG